MANRVSVFCCSKKYNPFIMEVNSGADSQFTIPTSGSGYNYDLRVQGGQAWYGLTGNHTINFPSANTDYFIEISGDFPRIYFNNTGDKDKILSITQWGGIVFDDFYAALRGAVNMTVDATDVAIVDSLTRTSYMFENNKSLVSYKVFDMSNVVEAINMHAYCDLFSPNDFNPTLSALTDGQYMYRGCIAFNPPNYAPTLSALTNGGQMYQQCTNFNPPNYTPALSALTDGQYMYYLCTNFNPPNYAPALSALTDGYAMYRQCTDFNPPNYAPTLSALTNGQQMYYQCTNFNPPNYAPTLSALTNGQQMYYLCTNFNPIGWQPDLSNATDLRYFLGECHAFSQDISGWDVSSCVYLDNFKRHNNPNTSSLTHDILLDSPTTGSISAVDIRGIFRYNKSDKIAMQCGNVQLIDIYSFQSSVTTKLILIDLGVSHDITTTPNVLGVDIDNLANSVEDLTGSTGAVLTLSLAQSTSGMDAGLWSAKNWTLNII